MKSAIIVISLVILSGAQLVSTASQKSTTYRSLTSSSGAIICALDTPTTVIAMNASRITKKLKCGVECTSAACCLHYQINDDLQQCQLYNYTPTTLNNIQHCASYQYKPVASSCSANSSYACVDAASNCSFPFTYDGALYYGCTQQMSEMNCAAFGCLMINRTVAQCKPPTDFTAITINVTKNGQLTIPTQSVFGWIVIMTRNGTDFNWTLPWNSYKNGFSLSNTDFWLGLERVHQLTSSTNYRLRIEVYIPPTRNWRSAEYWSFLLGDESQRYKLNVSGFTGDITDTMQSTAAGNNLNGMNFTTYDADNDMWPQNCAVVYFNGGGWWYNGCGHVGLTGGATTTYWSLPASGAVKQSRMMIKQQSFD